MKKYFRRIQQQSVLLHKEKSFGDYYFDYDPVHQTLKVRSNNATGDIIEEYIYDVDGSRAIKYEPQINQTTYYVSDNFIEIANSTGNYKHVYYYQDDVLVGRKDADGRKYFYHPDHLGSTDLVTDENQNIVEETTYKPYGEVIDDGFSRFLHGAKELDSTGLYYYPARYYDPFCRCFISPDPNIPDVYNSQALNRYSFVYNNPYKYVDPSGNVVVIPAAILAFTAAAAIAGSISFAMGFIEGSSRTYSDFRQSGASIFKSTVNAGLGGVHQGGIDALAGIITFTTFAIAHVEPGLTADSAASAGLSSYLAKGPEGVKQLLNSGTTKQFGNNCACSSVLGNPLTASATNTETTVYGGKKKPININMEYSDPYTPTMSYSSAQTTGQNRESGNNRNGGSQYSGGTNSGSSSGRGGPNDPNRGLRASNRNRGRR